MSVFANGFLAYHIEVTVKRSTAESVKSVVKGWKNEFREQKTWPGFPGSMIERLCATESVLSATCEGPQSSLLIPLRMVKGLTGSDAEMSSVIGTGQIATAVRNEMASWEIDFQPNKELHDVDCPVEFSFRDSEGGSASLVLYPASRTRYSGGALDINVTPEHLILNRFNKGLSGLASQVSQNGGTVSFRPRELGRYDTIENYEGLLQFTDQLVLSSRHRTMAAFAKRAGLLPKRGWPENTPSLAGNDFQTLADWLLARMRPDSVVMLHRHCVQDTALYRHGADAVHLPAPDGYGPESRAARLQGALMGLIIANRQDNRAVDLSWQQLFTRVVEVAFQGTDVRPWQYPEVASKI